MASRYFRKESQRQKFVYRSRRRLLFLSNIIINERILPKRKIPEMIRNTGKSNSYHSFAIFSILYEFKKLPDIKYYNSFINRSKDLNIKTEIYKFNDNRKYILESYEPYNNVTRNLGELQLFLKT